MITRSKLVEQLRDYQIRSQNTYPALIFFSPKPHIASRYVFLFIFFFIVVYLLCFKKKILFTSCRADVAVATFWAFAFSVLVILSYLSLYFRHYWLSCIPICLGIFLPIRLRGCRQTVVKKRERKFLLPLSM
ncbi:hypothetical protein Gotri_003809 [Gossypium trilobum]|uniref:Uncharacterized protein n=2 Tax=Gossypium TaxID=3633 RepID=A0A7J9F2M3_9ROSI|nr:hypothetical protein [Gossypium davidsonii]MBA0779562.1 hypothetical protein [Gossypium trilobum]